MASTDDRNGSNEPHSALSPDPVIDAYKRDLDRTLIRENLKLTVDERFQRLRQLLRVANEVRNAKRRPRIE